MKGATTSNRLKQIMTIRGLKQVDVLRSCEPYCKQYNVKMGSNDLSQYVNGKVQPKQDKLSILGMALNVNEAWLMGYDVPMNRETKEDKLIETIKNNVFNDDEVDQILNFIDFLISKRK